uniref:Uncharacterized protein n=1 Tax=Hemiselmis andersenii TaxID=464988 RepID=A0A6U4UF19_HEMAN|mmetsp:Transcript_4328/g.9870  ORF Transcript_4328/g.9870 Transcript_4328/m.9870 type:complete len:151 (+) Transcript_4328:76-528(+)|eukprot:CAMPEP_0114125620 /NCGR_PEP_ID=MMETSP0043_2-20121206/9396_1 /TAXON_ID=464988 /ORGANISM="Hemiselmis andersenii, Strain CCMP644" /LENGTH=150 /DNA_ID=CAMNT_0001218555 /DNA_START=62 /DNA_END=514 /DNA_ORIENTATION=+
MPVRHKKGDIIVPNFLPGGTGRDLYLDSSLAGSGPLKTKPFQYQDAETGHTHTLYWWTKLPAGGEYKERCRKQRAMADRLSQLPKQGRSRTLSRMSQTEQIEARLANETFNPWSVHQTRLRNYAVTHGMQTKPTRFEPGRMLVGLTDIIV